MLYQVTANFFFVDEDEANDFFHDCEIALPKATVVKPGEPNQECSVAELIHCNHDLTPPEPCEVVEHIDNCPLLPD